VERLCDAVRRKRPELWRSGECFLHHNNAAAHKNWVCGSFSRKKRLTTPSHPLHPGPVILRIFSKNEERPYMKAFSEYRGGEIKRQRNWRLSLCKSSRTVVNNGKTGGISVLILEESVLKVIKFWKCSEEYRSNILHIFGFSFLCIFVCMYVCMYAYMYLSMYEAQ